MGRVFPNWGQDDLFPSIQAFRKDFARKFGREMTAEEERLYCLTKDFLEHPGFIERRKINLELVKDRRKQKAKVADEGAA